jgi:hypothetical protein
MSSIIANIQHDNSAFVSTALMLGVHVVDMEQNGIYLSDVSLDVQDLWKVLRT